MNHVFPYYIRSALAQCVERVDAERSDCACNTLATVSNVPNTLDTISVFAVERTAHRPADICCSRDTYSTCHAPCAITMFYGFGLCTEIIYPNLPSGSTVLPTKRLITWLAILYSGAMPFAL